MSLAGPYFLTNENLKNLIILNFFFYSLGPEKKPLILFHHCCIILKRVVVVLKLMDGSVGSGSNPVFSEKG